jgi:hypothetical protein
VGPTGARPPRRRAAGRRRLLTLGLSLAAHLAVLVALLSARHQALPAEPPPMVVALVGLTPEPDQGAPPAAAQAEPTPPEPPKAPVKPTPPRPDVKPVPASERPEPTPAPPSLSEAQVASAATAGSGAAEGRGVGAGGQPCDMVRRLQSALRKDARIQAAVAEADSAPGQSRKALYVWNGEWIRSSGQDGNGLAAVREAIMWEVAFAPETCRTERVHGLVLLSLSDGGAGRLVMGGGDWRWSDLLRPRAGS